MTKKRKGLMLVFAGAIVIGGAVAASMYFKPHRNIQDEKPLYTGYASDFFKEFEKDSTAFKTTYEDQAVVLTGEITFMESSSFELDGAINCYLDSTVVIPDSLKRGVTITLKGRYVGYKHDDFFGTTILDVDNGRFQ